jgi:hypothetical protein
MKWFSEYRMRLVFMGVVAALVFSIGGRVKADFVFGEPTNLGPIVNSGSYDEAPSISADGLSLYFGSWRSGGYGNNDLWVSTRPTTQDEWGEPQNLGSTVNTSDRDGGPRISADGLSLYFNSTRPGGYEPTLWGDVWVAERATTSDPWGDPVNLGPIINTPSHAFAASISHDGLSLYFGSDRAGGSGSDDLWVTTRATTDDPWEEPVNLGTTVNGSTHDADPSISADGLALFFSDYALAPYRPGGYGSADLWITTRPTISDPWNKPVNLGPTINSSYHDFAPSISADGSTLYFMSDRPGGYGLWDLWEARIIPIVDLNGDEIVDAADMCIMVDHWGEDYSLCDIGPMPWGDGVVDVQDLIVLAEHLFEEILPSDLIAYWKLDETEGHVAQNSISDNHGILHGEPLWQPHSGKKGGALEFDGIDDYVRTDSVLNPSQGVFSVLVWVKGGAPGQAVLSQDKSASWLCSDSEEGYLVTELKGSGRSAGPLRSQTIITDGTWHRIGFVWDGSHRTLYVDDVVVAKDTQDSLEGSSNGLYFGVGSNLTVASFFSGLIDDIRIYDRVIHP